jgi:hypothetical protein
LLRVFVNVPIARTFFTIARYKLDLVGVQEVRWVKGGTLRAGDFNFFCGKVNENHQWEEGFLYTTE